MDDYRISIDVGGTFTDLIALSEEDGGLCNIKIPTTPSEPDIGVMVAFRKFLTMHPSAGISTIIHATTIATNMLTGQIGLDLPKTALITTKGFRDIIEIGRQRRHELYNIFLQRPKPLVQRTHRYTVEERVTAEGEILQPVEFEAVREIAEKIRKEKIETVAIGLLNSYLNPEHEIKLKKWIQQLCEGTFITASHEVSPEHREYERFSTVVVNACLMPVVSSYINKLLKKVGKLGIRTQLYVMQSSGGIASADTVLSLPASIIESGPAAGVIAAAFYGKMLNINNVLSFDMGGTTAKAGLVKDFTPEVITEYEVGGKIHTGRVIKGSGYPVKFPFIDLAECSAGGGTIAWVDAGGGLRVGPLSAGAEPGPACYGLNGNEPTITDANLVLGRLNPNHLLGGGMKLERNLAEKVLKAKICDELNLNLVQAAAGIVEIANSTMAKILRIVSVERGHDPRKFSLLAFGGAGPMHACALAENLGIPKIVVPSNPGLFSALGMLAADFTHHIVKPIMTDIDEVDAQILKNVYEEMEENGRSIVTKQQTPLKELYALRYADLRYRGQAYELMIPTRVPLRVSDIEELEKKFHQKHRSIYGYAAVEEKVEMINLRVTIVGVTGKPKIQRINSTNRNVNSNDVSTLSRTSRQVFFEEMGKFIETPVYNRQLLRIDHLLDGPCVIEQYDATTVVYPSWRVAVDATQNLTLLRKRNHHA
jgi:N-methylhydantoinase A